MLNSNVAKQGDVFEVVSMKFKEGVSLEKQQTLMQSLDDIAKAFNGFKSRDYFYSQENGRWIDFVVWTDLASAHKASQDLMKDPRAGELMSVMDEETIIFSHYDRVGGIK